MAKLDKVRGETIELLRGRIDFYMLRGILPVARSWPKKPKPPYTALQAEYMAVFSIARSSLKRISANMLEEWRKITVGKRPQWTDVFTKIIMRYYYYNKSIPLIALDYLIIETELTFQVKWTVLQLYLDPEIPEEITDIYTDIILKSDLENYPQPISIILLDDFGDRLVAPYMLFEVEL